MSSVTNSAMAAGRHSSQSIHQNSCSLDKCFYVGDVYVNPLNNTFECDDRAVSAPPKAILILQRFALSPGKLVSFDEITDFAWGRMVSNAALYQQLAVLRKLLNEASAQTIEIKTISRRGYRLMAPVNFSGPNLSEVKIDIAPIAVKEESPSSYADVPQASNTAESLPWWRKALTLKWSWSITKRFNKS